MSESPQLNENGSDMMAKHIKRRVDKRNEVRRMCILSLDRAEEIGGDEVDLPC